MGQAPTVIAGGRVYIQRLGCTYVATVAGLGKERIWRKCLHPGYAPRHRVPGSLPYFVLVLQFGNSGGPLVNLVSGTSFFPRIPAPGQCEKGCVFPNSTTFGQVSEQSSVGYLPKSNQISPTPQYFLLLLFRYLHLLLFIWARE